MDLEQYTQAFEKRLRRELTALAEAEKAFTAAYEEAPPLTQEQRHKWEQILGETE